MSKIPSQVMDFRLYNSSSQLIGTGEEITLPTISTVTKTVNLAGGNIDLPSMATENLELEIPFTVFDEEEAGVISLTNVTTIIIRGSLQKTNQSSHDFDYSGIVITAKGFAKEIEIGKLKRADGMDSKIKMSLSYLKVAPYSGTPWLEIDKLNGTFKLNGEDVRAGIDKYL